LAIFISAIGYLLLGSYTRRVTVTGEITTSSGFVYIHSDKAATVSIVLVKQGQQVRKGQRLVVLASSESTSGIGNVSERLIDQISHQRELLEAQIETSAETYTIKSKELQNSIASLMARRERVQQQLDIVGEQIVLLSDRQSQYEELLQRQYLTKLQVDENHSDLLSTRMQAKTLQLQDSDIQAQLASARSNLSSLPLEKQARLDELRAQIAQVTQQEIQAKVNGTWDARSPIQGVVTSIPVKAGQSIVAQQSVATIVPIDAQMEANIRVPDAAAGLVEPGQPVLLRLTAFPYQKYGQLPGRVVSVDRSPVVSADYTSTSANQSAPLYRAVAALDSQSVVTTSGTYQLLPGMTFEADLMLERRRLFEWVIAPVVGFKRRNFEIGDRE
jgi:membrane fusion protein